MNQAIARKEMAKLAIQNQEKHGNRVDAQSKVAAKLLRKECEDFKYYSEHQRDFNF